MSELERYQRKFASLRSAPDYPPLKRRRLYVVRLWKAGLTFRYDYSKNEYVIVPISFYRNNNH